MLSLAWHTVIFVVGFAALFPVRLGDLQARPHPASGFAAASQLVSAIQASDDSVAAPGGRTILMTHGRRTPRVVVLYHGLTDSPLQFLPLAVDLYEAGDNVLVPRLPHHAERAGNMHTLGELNIHELRDFGDRTIDAAAGLGDTVIVAGLSAGGTISAWTAQYRREVRRAVLIAPALGVMRIPGRLNAEVLRMALRAPNVQRSSPRDSTAPDRLPGWTTHLLAEVALFGTVIHDRAGSRAPAAQDVALLLNANDRTIPGGAALDLMHRWADHGAYARVYELDDTLRLPHDVIDPRQTDGDTTVVYPVLTALINGERPATLGRGLHEISISGRPIPRTLASSAPAPR